MKFYAVFAIVLGFAGNAFCQQTQPMVISNYTGRQINMPWDQSIKGNPYLNKDLENGKVVFMNNQYIEKVKLHYDVVNDKPVFQGENGNLMYFRDQVKEFTIPYKSNDTTYNAVFRFIDYNKNDVKPDSYYEVLYDGSIVLFKRHMKQATERRIDVSAVETYFKDQYAYYILRENSLRKISSKSTLVSALKTEGKDVDGFIKKNKINIKDDSDLRKVMEYVSPKSN
jgi:hypothetical protein